MGLTLPGQSPRKMRYQRGIEVQEDKDATNIVDKQTLSCSFAPPARATDASACAALPTLERGCTLERGKTEDAQATADPAPTTHEDSTDEVKAKAPTEHGT